MIYLRILYPISRSVEELAYLHTDVGIVKTDSYDMDSKMPKYKAACLVVQLSNPFLSTRSWSIFVNVRI